MNDINSGNLAIFYQELNYFLSYKTEVSKNHGDIMILFPEPKTTFLNYSCTLTILIMEGSFPGPRFQCSLFQN